MNKNEWNKFDVFDVFDIFCILIRKQLRFCVTFLSETLQELWKISLKNSKMLINEIIYKFTWFIGRKEKNVRFQLN